MVLSSVIRIQFFNLLNIDSVCRLKNFERSYSVYPKYYVKPIYDKSIQQDLCDKGTLKELGYQVFKPPSISESSSEFFDPIVTKFINYLTKDGKKINARCLVEKVFENIKITQLHLYNTANPESKSQIELDPKVILYKAIKNCSPVLELINIRQGGQTYKVPSPIVPNRSRFLAVKWLLTAAKEKKREDFVADRIAEELLDAFNNQGRVIKLKEELYKQCLANRSYAHFRW